MYLADSLSFFMLISFKKYSLALNEPVKFKDVSLKNRKMLFLSWLVLVWWPHPYGSKAHHSAWPEDYEGVTVY